MTPSARSAIDVARLLSAPQPARSSHGGRVLSAFVAMLPRPHAATLALLLVVGVLMSCGSDEDDSQRLRAAVASCEEAMAGSSGPSWRRDATTAGPFGFFGAGRRFRGPVMRELDNGQFLTKVPVIVDGKRPVVLRVPEDELGRVGLDYGDLRTEEAIEDAPTEVTFRPCRDRPRTGWPGGLLLQDRRPITVLVKVAGEEPRPLRVGRG